jgi:hypothetical protein
MRGMCRSTGGIIGTAVIVVVLELSADKAAGLRTMFTAYGLLLLTAIPLTLLIPEMARGGREKPALLADASRRAAPTGDRPGDAPKSASRTVGAASTSDR